MAVNRYEQAGQIRLAVHRSLYFPTAMYQLTARVHGRVQGVGFRAFTYRTAQRLRVTGYVKNLPDGTVELMAEGSELSLQELLEAVTQGPDYAHVTDVDSSTVAIARANFPDFSIQH